AQGCGAAATLRDVSPTIASTPKGLRNAARSSETPLGIVALPASSTQGSRCAATPGYVAQPLRGTCTSPDRGLVCNNGGATLGWKNGGPSVQMVGRSLTLLRCRPPPGGDPHRIE